MINDACENNIFGAFICIKTQSITPPCISLSWCFWEQLHFCIFRYASPGLSSPFTNRGVNSHLKLGGHVRSIAARRRRRCPAAPSILPKTGWVVAYPAHPPVTPPGVSIRNIRICRHDSVEPDKINCLWPMCIITVQGTATSFAGVRVLASNTGQAERAASTGNATDRLHSDRFGKI